MARKRMLAASFWDDAEVAKLNPYERLLFIGMISFADDYGHVSGDAAILRRWVFGYDDGVTVQQVAEMRDRIIANCHNVILYQRDGQGYIWLRKWERHQDLRFRARGQYPCHNCGKLHTFEDYADCVDVAPKLTQPPEVLRNNYAITTQELTQILPPDHVHVEDRLVEDRLESIATIPNGKARDSEASASSSPAKQPSQPLQPYESAFLELFEFRSGRYPTKAMRSLVQGMVDKYGDGEFLAAAKIAAERNVRKLPYVEGILKKGGASAKPANIGAGRGRGPDSLVQPGKYAQFTKMPEV